jgi:hypothetical protein
MNINANRSRFSVAREAVDAAFKNDVRRAIQETIANLDSGTVGISKACLWQMAVSRVSRSSNGPVGTNAAYFARQTFDQVLSESQFSNFVY